MAEKLCFSNSLSRPLHLPVDSQYSISKSPPFTFLPSLLPSLLSSFFPFFTLLSTYYWYGLMVPLFQLSIVYYCSLIIVFLIFFQVSPVEAPSGWVLCSYDMPPHFLSAFFLSGTWFSLLFIYPLCLSPRIKHFSGKHWLLLEHNGIRPQYIWTLGLLIASACLYF